MKNDLARLRASGGFLGHWVNMKTSTALCGFKPGTKGPDRELTVRGRQMKYRHGWKASREFYRECEKCNAKYKGASK